MTIAKLNALLDKPAVPLFAAATTSGVARSLAALDADNRKGLAAIWANLLYTPQEAFNALGTKAVGFVSGSAATSQFLAARYAEAGGVPQPNGAGGT